MAVSRRRLLLLAAAIVLIGLSWRQVWAARSGLVIRPFTQNSIPMIYMAPADAVDAPGILVAHGFSGSRQLMYGFGHALAHAGYGVLLWDFGGHGANGGRLDRDGGTLQANVAGAYAALTAQPEIDPARVGLLGHSMGSGAVMTAGIADPAQYAATVAVSPTGADVSPDAPPNLLLLAGSLEPPFVENAVGLLARAGGENDSFADGRARRFIEIPNVEHITILFTPLSHEAARAWFDEVWGAQTAVSDYRDGRMVWYGAHLLGWLLLATAVAPLLPSGERRPSRKRFPWHWVGLVIGIFAAGGLLALVNLAVDVSRLGGLLVGGGLGLWFLLMGGIWLGMGIRPWRPDGRSLLWGLAVFGLLWLAFGALGQFVWIQWWLIPVRLARWPLMAAALLPWFLAAGVVQQGASAGRRAAWWLAQSGLIVAGLLVALLLMPSLFFVSLVLPIVPIVLAVLALVGGVIDDAWATAVGNALFFAWLLLAVFPLAS